MKSSRPYAIGYCSDGNIETVFHDSLVGLVRVENDRLWGVISICGGPLVHMNRNRIVEQFLEGDAEYLLMLDTDMKFTPFLLQEMEQFAAPDRIISGLYFAFETNGRSIWPLMYDDNMTVILDYPENVLARVGGTGGGCLLIPRRILEELGDPWFILDKDSPYGEDQIFVQRVKELGYNTYIHTALTLGHVKKIVIEAEDYKALRASKEN